MEMPFADPQPLAPGAAGGSRAGWRLIALALLAPLGLLLSFHQVVQGAVERGAQRRQALAVHADAAWRCRDLRPTAARVQCLGHLGPAP